MEFSFYHITDSHYFSKKNYDASPWETPRYNDQLTIRESEELLKGALDIVKADGDAKSVFLTGDITERGDIDSLNECYALLSEYDRELSVYAFLDTHDYFSDAAVTRFDAEGKRYGVKIDNEPEKNSVRNAFKKFGTEKAKYVYTDGFTCFIEVSAGIYYIQLRNYENEKGFRVFDDAMIDWVVEKAEKLKKQGAFMFAGVHIPVMTPSPIYIILGNGSVPVNGEEIAERFADAGISFIISGHSHIHSIRRRVSKKGCVCYEIGTGSLGGYPGKIRKITIDTEQNKVTVKSLYVNPCELKLGKSVSEYGKEIFTESISPVFYNMEHNVEELLKTGGGVKFPEKAILKHKKLIMKMGKKINGLTFGKIGDLIRFETDRKSVV